MTRRTISWMRAGVGTMLLLGALVSGCGPTDEGPEDEHSEHEGSEARGPHGGRLLASDDFALELRIFEGGTAPEFRAWATMAGHPLAPGDIALEIVLTRLGGREDVVRFEPRGDHLVSIAPIAEPHSFAVSVAAVHEERRHLWEFESFEGRTRIDPAMAASLGVETELAGPATVTTTVTVYGRVRADPERIREIRARFAGVIRGVRARLGDSVAAGEKLLSVESNESLAGYAVVAPIAGVVTQRDANPGEQTSGRLLMTITDTSSVWVDLSIFPVDREAIAVGSKVSVTPALGGEAVLGEVSLFETVADPHDQSVVARVVLKDAGALLVPGTFVTAEVRVAVFEVPLAVKRVGLQGFREFRVVYAVVGDFYQAHMLDLGRGDHEWVEVLGGLEPGTRYVTSNSHLLKADIEKSSAAHDH